MFRSTTPATRTFWAFRAAAFRKRRTPEAHALAAQDSGQTEVALAKYERVAAVKATAQVEYRIASCYENLGQFRLAARAYETSARLGLGEAGAADVVTAANDRMAALALKLTRLSVTLRGMPAQGVDITLDGGETIARGELRAATLIDPGPHVVAAVGASSSTAPYAVFAVAGGRLDVEIELQPAVAPAPPAPLPRDVGIAPLPPVGSGPMPLVLAVVGASLGVAAGVLLLVRGADIEHIRESCPGSICPLSREADVSSTRDRALWLGPVAAVSAVAAGGALAASVVLFVTARKAPGAAVIAAAVPTGVGLACVGRF